MGGEGLAEEFVSEKLILECTRLRPTAPSRLSKLLLSCSIRDRESRMEIGKIVLDDYENNIQILHPKGWKITVGGF